MRYRFFTGKDESGSVTTVCVSHYAGKSVVGRAKCHANDKFDAQLGEELAKARCDLKVAEKRYKRATKKLEAASEARCEAIDAENTAQMYYLDSARELSEIRHTLTELEEKLK